jgi:hypothetical protein
MGCPGKWRNHRAARGVRSPAKLELAINTARGSRHARQRQAEEVVPDAGSGVSKLRSVYVALAFLTKKYDIEVVRPEGFEPPTNRFEVIRDTLLRNPTKTALAGFSKT